MGVGLKENIHTRWYKDIQPYITRVKWSRAVQGICYRDAGVDTNHKPAYVSQVESWKIDMKIHDKDLTENL